MNTFFTSKTWRMVWVSAFAAFAVSVQAEGLTVSNIGFMENPSQVLKEKFPMCDVFLKVDWIDKKKKIGYSNYEAIIKTPDGKFKDKKMMWALVDLDVPRFDYDVYQYMKQDRLEDVFDMVRKGRVRVEIPMMIDYMGETIALYGGGAVNGDAIHPLLSDHLQTVCIAYPDEQRAWIVEGKNIKQTYSTKQIEDLARKIMESTGKQLSEHLMNFWIVDVNFDGVDDYFYRGGLLYSQARNYFWWTKEFKHPNFKFNVPTSDRACYLKDLGGYSLTTDGKNFYFVNQCNLTELTSTSGRE
jgi:hypothetical protein